MRRFTLKLPTIPQPAQDTRTVFVQAAPDKPHAFIQGKGPADLLCGKCEFKLVKGIGPGQITNLVLKCPKCESYNDIRFVPALEELVAELIAAPDPIAKATSVKKAIETARDAGATKDEVAAVVQSDSEVLAKYLAMLEPKSAGDLYGMLGCIITFLTFLVALKQLSSPAIVVNQYITNQTEPMAPSRSSPCPCGSGKKFKQCHGRRK